MTGPNDDLAGWLASRRWFAGARRLPRPELLAEVPLARGFLSRLFADRVDPRGVVYQVVVDADGADATDHPELGAALLEAMDAEAGGASRPLGVEQSNTSLIVDGAGGPPAIVKLYRVLRHGANPEVETARVLAERGAPVPAFRGSLAATWPDADGLGTGHLAVAQDFLAGSRDAWALALDAAAGHDGFLPEAEGLGRATGELHAALAAGFPVSEADPGERLRIRESWRARLAESAALVRAVADLAPAIEAAQERALDHPWPTLQRVHGDLHLGQVLGTAQREWRFVDFEGEPLRPLAERTAPDLALRDVAGMLRSFAYVGASVPGAGERWPEQASRRFLDGYAATAPEDARAHADLLRALILDKAVYEALYEALNRPDWLPIPLAALRSALGAPAL